MRTGIRMAAAAAVVWLGALDAGEALACSSIIVTRGASADGSVFVTYTCDWWGYAGLEYTPAADHQPGDSLQVAGGWIPQVPHTYAVIANRMNEHQVATSESTFDGRPELVNPQGLFFYEELMRVALQRSRTARETILTIGDLVKRHGYLATGESFSITDPDEAWIMEIIGPGPGGTGAQWVAVRIPDGQISCHANESRIGEFPLDDPENCLYSDNVISSAVEKGYYDPRSGKPFSFRDAYAPATLESRHYCDTRVWSIYRRAAPSLDLSPDYHRGVEGSSPYPLWIRPDRKLSLPDVLALMRDHYEGTEYDMTQGPDAGPFCNPNRYRPTSWEVDGTKYAWERPLAMMGVSHTYIAQLRRWLPSPVGAVLWYSVDDPYTSCYLPFYVPLLEIPRAFRTGGIDRFTWDSAWWSFNLVGNLTAGRWSQMIGEVQAAQAELEGDFLALQPAVEKTAVELYGTNPALASRYLTRHAVVNSAVVMERWHELAGELIRKHNDGYLLHTDGSAETPGYPVEWLRRLVEQDPARFRIGPSDSTEHSTGR
ncbi:MAG: C69 family dipeptidase [Candidatus Latescibacterota bacterium]